MRPLNFVSRRHLVYAAVVHPSEQSRVCVGRSEKVSPPPMHLGFQESQSLEWNSWEHEFLSCPPKAATKSSTQVMKH